jgi:hypothetical protein
MAHILPHWTWPEREGEVTPVHVFSSGDEAELFVNGQSQGKQDPRPYEYRFRWDYTTYQPGELKVVVDKDGKEWATEVVKTAGAPAALEATPGPRDDQGRRPRPVLRHGARRRQGRRRRAARRQPRDLQVEGPARSSRPTMAIPTDLEAFPSPTRKAFNGQVMAIVRAKPDQAADRGHGAGAGPEARSRRTAGRDWVFRQPLLSFDRHGRAPSAYLDDGKTEARRRHTAGTNALFFWSAAIAPRGPNRIRWTSGADDQLDQLPRPARTASASPRTVTRISGSPASSAPTSPPSGWETTATSR